MSATIALRVDVDTRRGLDEGVPRLLALLRRYGVVASFFVTMGPDRSGLTLRRAWRPSFVAKMWRSRAWRLYGLRTIFSGTVLPARPVGAGAPETLRAIAREGHELGPHGYDHVSWQDTVHRFSAAECRADLEAAARVFAQAVERAPDVGAAPGWRTTPLALDVQDEIGYRLASDVRGGAPFRPLVAGKVLRTVQVPTTMPTMDELLGRARDLVGALENEVRPGLNVFTIHAEVEGASCLDALEDFLARQLRRGHRVVPLSEGARPWVGGELPLAVRPVGRGRVPGRSGWVAMPEDA